MQGLIQGGVTRRAWRLVTTTTRVVAVAGACMVGACGPASNNSATIMGASATSAPGPAEPSRPAATPRGRLEDGMLIFREGRGPEAESVRTAQRGRTWTHVGLLSVQGDVVTVLHAVPSEVPGRADGVVEDPLSFFVAPERATHHAIFRLVAATAAQGAEAVDSARKLLGRPFGVPDARHADRVTCTSFVLAAWGAVPRAPVLHPATVDLPLVPRGLVLPADLAAAPELTAVDLGDARTPS